MGDLLALPTRDSRPPDGWDGLACPNCGSAWFFLGSRDGENFVHGEVVINQEGSVTGYSGTPHCRECLTEVLPSSPFLT